jgi:hypothetical protein
MNRLKQLLSEWSTQFPIVSYLSILFILLIFVALLSLSCKLPVSLSSATPPPEKQNTQTAEDQSALIDKAMTLDEALSISPEDNRPQVLRQMGAPDAFKITFTQLNSQPVRQDEWSYFDDKTRFDFIDGALAWTLALEPMPDSTLNASYYDPMSFTPGMTVDEVKALLGNQELVQVDLAENGITGGSALAGDQILLGFDQGNLVYVETFALIPQVKP